jgi:hypothetical protein
MDIANGTIRIIAYRSVKSNRRFTRLVLAPVATLILCAGCGGISASRTVSPINFLVPGLIKAEPKLPTPDDSVLPPAPAKLFALLDNY